MRITNDSITKLSPLISFVAVCIQAKHKTNSSIAKDSSADGNSGELSNDANAN